MVDVGPLSPWRPSWMQDSSDWLWSAQDGFVHRWAQAKGGDLMSGQAVPVSISALINPINGESVPCPPGTQIMADDLDWMVHGWEAVFLIEWKIQQAEWAVKNHGQSPQRQGVAGDTTRAGLPRWSCRS